MLDTKKIWNIPNLLSLIRILLIPIFAYCYLTAETAKEYYVAAFIILKKDVAATEDEIREFVRKNMAKHKVPKYVCFVDEFPMNAAGKILKYKLREIVIEKFNLQSDDSIETA